MQAFAPEFRYDIEKLLSPISPENPAGDSLRYDPVYDRIKEMRREDDSNLPQGVWKTEQKQSNWGAVESACLDAIETRSKDLQIAAWLLESWFHLHGFAGAAEGFALILALCEGYWDGLHPRIEGGDVEFRIAPLIWIDTKLPVQLKLYLLSAPQTNDVPAYSWSDWEMASQLANQALKAPMAAVASSRKRPTLASFHQSAMLTPTPHFGELLADVERMTMFCERLELLLDDKLKKDSPGLVALRSAGESVADLLTSILRDRGGAEPSQDDSGVELEKQYPDGEPDLYSVPSLKIRTRAEAYQILSAVADYLERAEPHSPTPHLVRRAVRWGSLPLEKLLPELVRNPTELSEIYRELQMRVPIK